MIQFDTIKTKAMDFISRKDNKNTKFIVIGVLLILLGLLTKCSFDSPKDYINGALMDKYNTTVLIKMPWVAVGDVKILNEYTKKINDETVYIYDVVVDMVPDTTSESWKQLVATTYTEQGCIGGVNPTSCDAKVQKELKEYEQMYCGKGAKVTVGLVKRGNGWYAVN